MSYIDVGLLIEGLEVSPVIQQDALEYIPKLTRFSKLLISLLESIFASTGAEVVRDSIFNQYKGDLQYDILCKNCLSKKSSTSLFYELSISLGSAKTTLEDSLQRLLTPEHLIGENQYMCSTCSSKQDATKTTKLNSLPKTINFVINRFVFDLKTLSKKKVSTTIEFPQSINMAKYKASNGICTVNDRIYHLTAVLLHRGPNANSGHYIARVYNHEVKAWLNCDDESVTVMNNPDFEITEDLPNSKKNAPAKTATDRFTSSSAYMLVYERINNATSDLNIPPHLVEGIAKENAEFASVLKKEADLYLSLTSAKQKIEIEQNVQAKFEKLFKVWDPKPSDEFVYVSTSELKIAIEAYTGEQESLIVSNSKVLCRHGSMDPNLISKTKRITLKGLDILRKDFGLEIEPSLSLRDVCDECFTKLLAIRTESYQHQNDLVLYSKCPKFGAQYFISKTWFLEWRKKYPLFEGGLIPNPMDEPYQSDVMCEHKNLSMNAETLIPEMVCQLLN